MNNTLKNNAKLLNLNAPSIYLTGTRSQKVEQLMEMFDEVVEKIKEEPEEDKDDTVD